MKYIELEGQCPLLLCLAKGKHKHPICPKCGAVGFGNIFCDTCQQNVDIEKEMTLALLKMGSKYYPLTLKGGKILQLPSVNTCLPPPAYMRFSPNGTWVGAHSHTMVDRIIKGEIITSVEWNNIHPEVKQSVRAFVRWLQQVRFTPVASEVFVYSLEFGYAGTLDILGKYRRRNSIGDFKTGDADILATAMKLAAYDHAYFEMNPNLKPGPTWHIKIDKKTGAATWIKYQRKEVEKYFELFIEEKNKVVEWVGKYSPKEILKEEIKCQNLRQS